MSIVAIIQFYNDVDGMKRLYSHLHRHNIKSIWADGRFEGFTRINSSDQSTYGSREFIKSKSDAKLYTFPVMFECDNKSLLLEKAKDYDYAIQFGCDEYPVGSFDELVRNLDKIAGEKPEIFRIYAVIDESDTTDRPLSKDGKTEKVFYKPHRIKCHNTHWSHFIDDSNKPYISPEYAVCGVIIHHDQSVREKSRENLMDIYQNRQYVDEREKYYMHKHGIDRKPTIRGLKKLFPSTNVIENNTNFLIKESIDTTKLPVSWVRCMTPDGLCITK